MGIEHINDKLAIQELRPVRHARTYRTRRRALLMVTAIASVKRHLGHLGSWLESNEKDVEGWRLHCGMVSQMEEVLYQTRVVYPSSVAGTQLDRARAELHHLRAAMRLQRQERAQVLVRHILVSLDSMPV
jgi:hypothetical protein